MTDDKTRAEILAIRLDNEEVVTRREAQLVGITRYYTGKQCAHGHTAMRLTSNGRCIECHRQKVKDKQSGRTARRAVAVAEMKDSAKAELLIKLSKEPEHMRGYAAEELQKEIAASALAIQEIINELGSK